METYPWVAVERAMKVQEVIMRTMAKKITWAQAGHAAGQREEMRLYSGYQTLPTNLPDGPNLPPTGIGQNFDGKAKGGTQCLERC